MCWNIYFEYEIKIPLSLLIAIFVIIIGIAAMETIQDYFLPLLLWVMVSLIQVCIPHPPGNASYELYTKSRLDASIPDCVDMINTEILFIICYKDSLPWHTKTCSQVSVVKLYHNLISRLWVSESNTETRPVKYYDHMVCDYIYM